MRLSARLLVIGLLMSMAVVNLAIAQDSSELGRIFDACKQRLGTKKR